MLSTPVRTLAAVAPLLGDSPRPLLDIGCGLGLLGQYLRECGIDNPYRGIDVDAAKIEIARAASRAGGLDLDLAAGSVDALPPFSGDVALLDVLHYLPSAEQQRALADAASRVGKGGMLVIRNVLRDRSWRFRATVLEERFSRALGWMLNYLFSGTLFRIYRASHRYGLALTYFQLLLLGWLAASVAGGWLTAWFILHLGGASALVAAVAGVFGAIGAFGLLRPLADRLFVVQINSH